MGRPPGSKNKKTLEAEAATVGHNTAELSDAEKQALLVRGLADLETMLSEKDEIIAEIRTQRKRLISYGFEAFEIDFALKLRKTEDSDAIARRRREAVIARFLNHPIGTQSDMFDEVDRTPAVDAAYEAGKVAGAEGKSANSPHPLGTEQNESWMKGWHESQQTLASGFKKLETAEATQAEAAEQDDLEVA